MARSRNINRVVAEPTGLDAAGMLAALARPLATPNRAVKSVALDMMSGLHGTEQLDLLRRDLRRIPRATGDPQLADPHHGVDRLHRVRAHGATRADRRRAGRARRSTSGRCGPCSATIACHSRECERAPLPRRVDHLGVRRVRHGTVPDSAATRRWDPASKRLRSPTLAAHGLDAPTLPSPRRWPARSTSSAGARRRVPSDRLGVPRPDLR